VHTKKNVADGAFLIRVAIRFGTEANFFGHTIHMEATPAAAPPSSPPAPPKTAFVRGVTLLLAVAFGFSLVYLFYTVFVDDDLSLRRESYVETLINCVHLSVLITAGSAAVKFEGKSVLARAVVTTHSLVSLVSKVFVVTLPLPIGR
jgi:hypothetical protein